MPGVSLLAFYIEEMSVDCIKIIEGEGIAHVLRPVRRIPANETPAAKMQRIIRAAVIEYAREHPNDLLEIVRKEILDKRK